MLFKGNARNTKKGFFWGGGGGVCAATKGRVFASLWFVVRHFQMNKKESVICEFETDFKKYFCCNDGIISVLCQLVMLRFETTSGSENGCGK